MNISGVSELTYSKLSIRATVFFAPRAFARTEHVMFVVSCGVTAMKRSAFAAPACLRAFRLVGDAFIVMRS